MSAPVTRRDVLLYSFPLITLLASTGQAAAIKSLKIGLIGAGRIGGTLAKLWADAGYKVMLSARELDPVRTLVAEIGPNASAGTPKEAAAFGDVVVVTVPYEAVPEIGRDYAAQLKGKVVLDTCNPKRETYAALSPEALALGTGIIDQRYLSGTRLVKAFNTINFGALKTEAHRSGEKAGVPLAGDDPGALAVAKQLVRDAGFEPVVAGGLASAKIFDSYTPFHANGLSANKVRELLAEKPAPIFTGK